MNQMICCKNTTDFKDITFFGKILITTLSILLLMSLALNNDQSNKIKELKTVIQSKKTKEIKDNNVQCKNIRV